MGRYGFDLDGFEDLPWFKRGRKRGKPRAVAIAAGCLLAWLAVVVIGGGVLTVLSAVVRAAGGIVLLAVILAAVAIYRAVTRHAGRSWDHDYEDDEDEEEREEWRGRRHHQGREREARRVPVTDGSGWSEPAPRPTGTSERRGHAGLGDLALMVTSGLGLALAGGFLLSGRAGASGLYATLTAVLAALGGTSVIALLRRWRAPQTPQERPTDGEVRAQLKRVRAKCARLEREARAARGVFGDLSWHAPSMAQRARELGELVLRLRRAMRATRRAANPTLPGDALPDSSDESLTREYRAAIDAQARLDRLIAENLRHQRVCLTQLERIEDLLDAARLELASPASAGAQLTSERTIVADVEAELEASRRALHEIERIEREETAQG